MNPSTDASHDLVAPPTRVGPLRVLVVDDDEASRDLVAKSIGALGYDCRVAGDGADAWEMQHARPVDVIVSDWRMPRVDGVELCRRTRIADGSSGYTYFILMTTLGDKEHFLQGMAAGADDYQHKPIDLDELAARLASASRVMALHRRLEEHNARLVRDSQASFLLARVDALTGVGNRLRMNEDVAAAWARGQRYDERYCIAICDVDRFKDYNDAYGHLAGDDVLCLVAERIRGELRRGDSVYRYGGEEFLVVLPDQTLVEATHAMDRVRRSVERLDLLGGAHQGGVTISIGVARLTPTRDESLEDWLARADAALYDAKAHGRNRVEVSRQ